MNAETATSPRFWIGPAGWSYPDWDGIVYPAQKPRGFRPLAQIARYFAAVEVNSSFYNIPAARITSAWIAQVPRTFRFAFKLTQLFTHNRDAGLTPASVISFKEGLRPVRDAGRLGPLLIQFPWSFRFTPGNADWLRRLADAFAEYERVIEVRHASWSDPEALAAVRACGACCNIDQPRLRDCLGPSAHAWGGPGYVRLHGRNAANWFAKGVPAYERYNYLYSETELREWVDRIRRIAKDATDVYVIANNHYRGQGVVNALELRALLEGVEPDAPPELLGVYPRLRGIARSTEPGLFAE